MPATPLATRRSRIAREKARANSRCNANDSNAPVATRMIARRNAKREHLHRSVACEDQVIDNLPNVIQPDTKANAPQAKTGTTITGKIPQYS